MDSAHCVRTKRTFARASSNEQRSRNFKPNSDGNCLKRMLAYIYSVLTCLQQEELQFKQENDGRERKQTK